LINPEAILNHTRKFTRRRFIQPNRYTLMANIQTQENDNNTTETIKEWQAHYITKTQFRPLTPPLSPPINKLAKLKAENYDRCLKTHISHLEEQIQWTTTTTDTIDTLDYPLTTKILEPIPYPTPLTIPPRFKELAHQININRTTAATQWAIDTTKSKEKEELPPQY
jgi:hypothetical protein